MGAADTVPGVSGGTVALILGIYERFIAAVSSIGPGFIIAIFSREFWRRVAKGLKDPSATGTDKVGTYAGHFLFLGFLLLGLGSAVLVGARFIPELLVRYPEPMNGFFLGLVIASCAIPYRLMKVRRPLQFVVMGLFAVGTFFFVALPVDQSQRAVGEVTLSFAAPLEAPLVLTPWQEKTRFTTNRYEGARPKGEVAFLPVGEQTVPAGATSAVVAVRSALAGDVSNLTPGELVIAEGLPGGAQVVQLGSTAGGDDPALWFIFLAGLLAISAMVLPGISGSFVLLMLGLYHYILFNVRALVYDRDTAAIPVIVVFIASLVIGIATFSRVLRWLFSRYHDHTLAALVGIMVGSVRVLWPFKQVSAEGVAVNAMPASFDDTFAVTVAAVVAGFLLVLVIERMGRTRVAPVEG